MITAVSVDNVCYSYKKIMAVRNAGFSIEKGTFTAIAGPNGSGKTTLLKMMSGLVKADSGTVSLFGMDIKSMKKSETAKKAAWVPQSPEPVFGYSVRELVMMGRAPHQGFLGIESKTDKKAVIEAMEQTDINGLHDRFLTSLSGGELQRVFIARALCQSSELIFLDEPTSSLDPAHQLQIMGVLKNLVKKNGSTVIMISHDLNLCSMYADKIMLMKDGKTAAFGKPESVLDPAMLWNVYGCRISVINDPDSGFSVVVPVPVDINMG